MNSNSNDPYTEIATEILAMVAVDQTMREMALKKSDFWDETVDNLNTQRMKKIIKDIGWPTIGKVGRDVSYGAWLLVQHADRDVAFQEQCLEIIKSLPTAEIVPQAIPYLEDRIRVNKKLPQVYGTQFRNLVPCPIENPDRVDERRGKFGLPSLAEGITAHRKKYPPTK